MDASAHAGAGCEALYPGMRKKGRSADTPLEHARRICCGDMKNASRGSEAFCFSKLGESSHNCRQRSEHERRNSESKSKARCVRRDIRQRGLQGLLVALNECLTGDTHLARD